MNYGVKIEDPRLMLVCFARVSVFDPFFNFVTILPLISGDLRIFNVPPPVETIPVSANTLATIENTNKIIRMSTYPFFVIT